MYIAKNDCETNQPGVEMIVTDPCSDELLLVELKNDLSHFIVCLHHLTPFLQVEYDHYYDESGDPLVFILTTANTPI
jgi:hypothetical protein